jgi:hypothetical protein
MVPNPRDLRQGFRNGGSAAQKSKSNTRGTIYAGRGGSRAARTLEIRRELCQVTGASDKHQSTPNL